MNDKSAGAALASHVLMSPHLGSRIAGLQYLWERTLGDPRVVIAVLDGPVDRSHSSLVAAHLHRLETLVVTTPDGGAASQHGTHVTSIIFGQPGTSCPGIAPRCRGLIAPIFGSSSTGELAPCSQIDLARAILHAAQCGAHVINISGGYGAPGAAAHPLLADAVRFCVEHGTLLIASVGNEGCDCLHVPAGLPSVLAVGAIDEQGLPLECSNWGAEYETHGVVAIGTNILGARSGGGTAFQTGTSFATAVVSGIAGLLLSLQLKLGKNPDPAAVRDAILRSARRRRGGVPDRRRLLGGRLDLEGAVSLLEQGGYKVTQPIVPPDTVQTATSDAHRTGSLPHGTASSSDCACGGRSEEQLGEPTRNASDAERGLPSACECGCGTTRQLVYALGTLGFDFGSEARRDSIAQHMEEPKAPYDPNQLLAYLEKNPWDSPSVVWTLNLDTTPIYAIRPGGPFASHAYERLRQFAHEQFTEGVERVSVPGTVVGKATLLTGQTVPVIEPALRGIYSWTTKALVQALVGQSPDEGSPAAGDDAVEKKRQGVRGFLERVYFEVRNLGLTPQERAVNFAATNAFNIEQVYETAIRENMELDTISVERSPICRPESDCWDVKLLFFYPERQVQTVRKVFRFTVDVSDVVPVTVGSVRSWFVR